MSRYDKKAPRATEDLGTVQSFPIWAIDGTNETVDWGISRETCEYFGVKTGWNEIESKISGYYFPVTKKGKLSGYIKVDPTKPKKKGRFTTVGDVDISCDLVGQAQAHKNKGRKLFIVEGMKDLLTAYQAINNNKGQYKGFPNVVTFALGIGDIGPNNNAKQALGHNAEFIHSYGTPQLSDKGNLVAGVVTCFDNDNPANDDSIINVGQEAVKDCALILKDFHNVVLHTNDCWDFVQEKGEKDLFRKLSFDSKAFENESILSGGLDIDELLTPLKKGVMVDVIPHTMNIMKGLRERELTVVLAPSGVGKTTLCKELGYALVKGGAKVGHIFLEEDLKKTQQSYIALDNDIHLPALRANPGKISREAFNQSYKDVVDTPNTMWMQHFGSLSSVSLMQKFEWMAIKGMQYIILDHISMVFSGQSSKNERQEIDQLLTEMASFTTKTGCHPIVVSHIRRTNKVLPKNKDGSTKFPYWDVVDETQARGSGAFEQLAWNIIAIEPEKLEDGSRGRIRTRVLKNREWGVLGVGDVLTQNPMTGRLQLAKEEEY